MGSEAGKTAWGSQCRALDALNIRQGIGLFLVVRGTAEDI